MPGQNLTRLEAADRSATVHTQSYDVTLDLTRGETVFGSSTTVRFTSTPGSSTFIDLIAPVVHSISLNGRALDPAEVYADSRITLTGLAADNELVVIADCAYMHTGEGLHRFTDPADGETYLYSQFEVPDSRRVFAVFEQPDLKASFTFTVTTPSSWTVLSNSPTPEPTPTENSDGSGDAHTFAFAPTEPMSSYVTAIVAGPYMGATDEYVASDGHTVPLGVYCRKSLVEHMDSAEILDLTKRGFAYYEDLFATPYAFTKYDQIFVPEFNAGAMENAGCVTHRDDYIFRSLKDATQPITLTAVTHAFADLKKRLNLPQDLRFHSFRHTHATLLAEQEISAKKIQVRLGHASAAFTMDRYIHNTAQMQDGITDKIIKCEETYSD